MLDEELGGPAPQPAAVADDLPGIPLGEGRLTRRAFAERSIIVMPRRLDPPVAAALDRLTEGDAPSLRLEGANLLVAMALESELRRSLASNAWLADWLASDIGLLLNLHGELTDARRQRVRLDSLTRQLCPKFHTDNNRARMVCAYRGPGTEWQDLGGAEARIRRLPRGHVALMRGTLAATDRVPALVHRSPPADRSGVRLLLTIDEI